MVLPEGVTIGCDKVWGRGEYDEWCGSNDMY